MLIRIIFFLLFTYVPVIAQSEFQQFISHLYGLETIEEKNAAIDSFMTYARSVGIPFVEENKANFIYNGAANSVAIAGDFNGWDPGDTKMTNMSGTSFFFKTITFELNARLDYKFVINNSNWILDSENPNHISGGFGPNSELAMPEYIQPWEINYNPSIPPGTQVRTIFSSLIMNRDYSVIVYLPPGYDSLSAVEYPTIYFHDGGDYLTLGSSKNVIDNLVDSNKIEKVIAVFVTPTNRNEEYAGAKRHQFAEFFAAELVPHIDSNYNTSHYPSRRLVLGDSFGGNISGLISYKYPEVFGNCGLHSAAFWPNDNEVYNLIVNGEKKEINYSVTWGTYEGLDDDMRNFLDQVEAKEYKIDWLELPEGHSWGQWRATTDFILESFFPFKPTSINESQNLPDRFELFQNYPNPFNPTTTIKYSLDHEANVKLFITDSLGQKVDVLVNKIQHAGVYTVIFDGTSLSSGNYIYSISTNGNTISKKMQLIK